MGWIGARPGPADGGPARPGAAGSGARGREEVAEVAEAVVRSAVFLDPTGRRWRRTRVVGTAVLLVLLLLAVVLGPGVWHSPALAGASPGAR